MKFKITLTMLSVLIALAMMPANANSQNNFSGVRNMGATLNTVSTEQNPALSPSGLSLYMATNRTAPGTLGGQDIWVSQRATLGSPWGAPQHLAILSSSVNEAVTSFSLDAKTIFLQSTRTDLGGFGGFDIYISTRQNASDDFGWTTPVNLGAVVNSTVFDGGANYFEDPTTGAGRLIFSSNRVGDPAIDFHLYQSTRNADGTFNAPTLIPELSSPMGGGAEVRTAIRRDGLEIFIASSRPGGMAFGLFDVWRSTRASVSSTWSTPILVPGINTVDNEQNPSLSPDGSILYFQSDSPGGFGSTDLYSATRCSLYAADAPCSTNRATADFDGDGRTDMSVFRPSDGNWYRLNSSNGSISVHGWGLNGDVPVAGDYDGDGRSDIAVFRPSDQIWYRINSTDNSIRVIQWGLAGDIPTPGDFDGDGPQDHAVFRPSNGTWFILGSTNGMSSQPWGLNGDIPTPGAFAN